MNTILPALRNIDAVAVRHEGQPAVCLYDPQGLVETQLVLSPPAFFVAACLDGSNTAEAVCRAFAGQYGREIDVEQVMTVVETLDAHGFLYTQRFRDMLDATTAAFHELDARPAHLAGKSYPADPDELRGYIAGFFSRKGAPEGGFTGPAPHADPLPFLVVPHIDFDRGGNVYAHGYQELFRHGKPDTVFVFGVAHAGAPMPFVLTRKHFETPFGTLQCDREIVDRLAAACDWDPYAFELVHRTEHSIEFQAVMLAYLYGPDVKIVPILAAQFSDDPAHASPREIAPVKRFLDECRAIASEPGRRVSVIAGADFAHVGKRFGDDFEIDDTILAAVRERDEEDLAQVAALHGEDFYASVMRDQNQRRVCGLGCVYAALKTVEGRVSESRVLHYSHAPDPAGGIVSFAAAAG